jgi:hypothetical protein
MDYVLGDNHRKEDKYHARFDNFNINSLDTGKSEEHADSRSNSIGKDNEEHHVVMVCDSRRPPRETFLPFPVALFLSCRIRVRTHSTSRKLS